MMKSIGLLPRRPDRSRKDFREHYESHHAPLALRHFPFERYVRNHLVDCEDIGFDTLSEFWASDLALLDGLMQSRVGDLMRADERTFMDQPRIRSAGAEERLLAGPPRRVEAGPRRRDALLLRRPGGISQEAFAAAADAWGRELALQAGAALERVSLDLLTPWQGPPIPFDAILWLWPAGAQPWRPGPPPAGVELWRSAVTESCETPIEPRR